ncbi:pyridoxamine 5'-phosphate oxidase family protein [Phaeobacter gallaeciensis]|uniref:HugZ family pyridoxamine 5'-phosphate oxidase n=1 Tax=Phaeobacter gallaeciensis TaxID=60890 RepID=UPI00238096C1|nr:pyridoxamine 5'-phosphate oxidase family protein [Phaeobacter gallaeciensis]MDE4274036.1 pyridoxamine 5'-phosphate oxidase family protein [Phaeobacter gallaeciensis]MDE4299276.1 pyridoxamine 5'-phosphate oxidase family protein [Phaeobacter gallaeciensis]MDE5184440.1 pyridoxamine 5'-phosphate oxidase family protein [Phaeobacter gallaeciensis]
MTDPIRPTDDEARSLARTLMEKARFAALGVISEDGTPLVTRVAFGLSPEGQPISLVSTLSAHTRALQKAPACSFLVGEPGDKGDPLTHPRLSLQGHAQFIPNTGEEHARLAAHYLQDHPKAKLYIGFGDFAFVRLDVTAGHLNGGFGKAFVLSPDDLTPPA